METFIAVFFVFCLIVAVLYIFLMAMLITGWLSLNEEKAIVPVGELRMSILVPARNEEKNIVNCLRSICSQNYMMDKVEIIVIDDNSTDNTVGIVKQYMRSFPGARVKLVELSVLGRIGKKQALSEGVKAASENVIITTDADTSRNPGWLGSIEKFFRAHEPKMIIGPVAYENESNWFEKMQSVEFAGLVTTAGGAAGIGMSIMCNGANLIFDKSAFEAVGGYSGHESIASGDDVILMTRIDRMFPGSVKFLRSKDAIVYTSACGTLKQFINQRVRWASKNRAGYNAASLAAGIIVLSMNFVVPAAFLLSIFVQQMLWFAVILLTVKCIIDFLFLFLAASFFEKRRFLFLFIPQQLLYMLYVNITGMLAIFSGYEWKGRSHR